MRNRLFRPILAACLCLYLSTTAKAQDDQSSFDKINGFPSRFISSVNRKARSLEEKVEKQTVKYLERLQRKEAKLKRKLSRIDSAAAAYAFNAEQEYAQLINKIQNPSSMGVGKTARGYYLPELDSLKGSLSFLQQNKQLLPGPNQLQGELGSSLNELKDLQSKLGQTDEVKTFIRQRKEQIKAALSKFTNLPQGITNGYNDYNKELYYYTQQIKEYKDLLNDPDKLTQKALSLLNKLPAFQSFMKQHGELAQLFGVPANYGTPQALAGLQTRAQVQQLIQTQISSAGPNAQAMLQQNLQAAQSELSQLKDKITKYGEGGGDIDMPNFKPNNQKTKSFWKRLEYGTNLQTAHGSYFYPTTTDMGLSVGYKLNNNSTIGIGGSYKMGWGPNIQHIALSSQGASLRSYIDTKLKGSFYISGGFEYNYQPLATIVPPTNTIPTSGGTTAPSQPLSSGLPSPQYWQQSGLIGLSKVVSLKTKFFKKTKLQVLWDFLSYEQVPKAQPIKFRVGYNF